MYVCCILILVVVVVVAGFIVKAYIRKGKIQHFLKQYHKALATFDQALEIEPNNAETMEAKR